VIDCSFVFGQKIPERIGVIFKSDLPFRDDVKEVAEKSLPPGQEVGHTGDDHRFDLGLGQNPLHISEVGIRTDDGFRPTVVRDISEIMRRVDGREGNSDRA